jgi:hypothetical protein
MVANSNEIAKSMESSPYERLELPCDEAARRAAVRLKLSLTSHRLEGPEWDRLLPDATNRRRTTLSMQRRTGFGPVTAVRHGP